MPIFAQDSSFFNIMQTTNLQDQDIRITGYGRNVTNPGWDRRQQTVQINLMDIMDTY